MRWTRWVLGVAALVGMMGGGSAMVGGDTSPLPLRGPISFEGFDLDESGGISQSEFDQVHARRAQEREAAGLPAPRQSRSFSSVDSDGDGSITRAELEAARGAGGDGPGRGAGTGVGWGMGSGHGPPSFADFDLNGDGAVSEQEFIDARTKRIAERMSEGRMMRGLTTAPSFADRDADGDGSLTPEEFAAGVKRHQERMGSGAPAEVDP